MPRKKKQEIVKATEEVKNTSAIEDIRNDSLEKINAELYSIDSLMKTLEEAISELLRIKGELYNAKLLIGFAEFMEKHNEHFAN